MAKTFTWRRHFGSRLLVCLTSMFFTHYLLVSISVILTVVSQRVTQCAANSSDSDSNIVFLGIVPACNQTDDGLSVMAESIGTCDVLTRAAIDLAVERVNLENQTGGTLRVLPVPGRSSESDQVSFNRSIRPDQQTYLILCFLDTKKAGYRS